MKLKTEDLLFLAAGFITFVAGLDVLHALANASESDKNNTNLIWLGVVGDFLGIILIIRLLLYLRQSIKHK